MGDIKRALSEQRFTTCQVRGLLGHVSAIQQGTEHVPISHINVRQFNYQVSHNTTSFT